VHSLSERHSHSIVPGGLLDGRQHANRLNGGGSFRRG
jgi:hypothetical protein